MTSLADWLGGEHDLGERLELIDNLCRALAAFHESSPGVRPALDPSRVELAPDLGVSLVAADPNDDGFQVPEYRAPEIVQGLRYTPTAGTYSAALLCYEVLAGRHPFVMDTPLGPVEAASNVPPAPLVELRPELPRELAEAVMPCLERDPEWRPKDLSYLTETLRKARAAVPSAPRRRAPVKVAPKPAPKPTPSSDAPPPGRPAAPSIEMPSAPRDVSRGGTSTSRLPLFAAAGAGLVLVLGGLWYVTRPASPTAVAPPAVPQATPTPAVDAPSTAPAVAPEADAVRPTTAPSVAPSAAASLEPPSPAPAVATPAPAAATPPPAVALAPVRESSPPVEAPRRDPAPGTPPPTAAPGPVAAAAASGPIGITAIVPSRLRHGPTVLVDVRGSGLRAGLDARILFKGREPAVGIQVVNQRFVNAGLLVMMLRIDAQARDGSYTLTLGDASGVSNARAFEVGR